MEVAARMKAIERPVRDHKFQGRRLKLFACMM